MTLRLLHSGAEVASGAGASIDTAGEMSASLDLEVSDGAPVVSLEGSADGTSWTTVISAIPVGTQSLYRLPRYLRAAWAGAGTFILTATTRALFCSPAEVRASIQAPLDGGPLGTLTDDKIEERIEAATAEILAAFQTAQFSLPIYAIGADTRQRCIELAAFMTIRAVGFAPDGETDLIVKSYDDAQAWLRRVAREGLRPVGIVDATPTRYDGGAAIAFRPNRRPR